MGSLTSFFKLKKTVPAKLLRRPTRNKKSFYLKLEAAGDRMAFRWSVRETLYRHLSAQVGNGIAVENALDTFRLRLQRRKQLSSDKIVGDLARRMRDGSTLASALAPWAPQDEVSVISSGEMSGRLPRSLDLVIEAKRRVARVNNALKKAMISPLIYVAVVYGMLWGIGRFVTPGLQQALPKDRARGMVAALYSASDFANSLWAIVPPILLVAAIIVVIRSLPKWTGRNRIAMEGVFPYSFYRDIQGYTWLMSFSALLRAGMSDTDILKRQVKHATPWLKERLQAIFWRMDNGASLPAALLAKGKKGMPPFGFPNPDIVDDIASMAGFSDFSDRIATVAVQWADELESATLARAQMFGLSMEILMYGVMGFLMVAINSMSTQMGSAAAGI